MTPDEEQEQRKRIAGWVREGKDSTKARKDRNHGIIQIGLAAMALVKAGELNLDELLKELPENKKKVVQLLFD